MAIVHIAEFSQLLTLAGYTGQMAQTPAIAYQVLTTSASSVQSNPFNAATRSIRVHTDTVASIDIRTNPVAVVSGSAGATMRMGPNQTEYFGVNPGDKLAAITDT